VIVGVDVLVVVGVAVAVGTGEGEGEFVGVKLAVMGAVGVNVAEAILSTLQAESNKNRGTNGRNIVGLPIHDVSDFLFIIRYRGPC
jgi:hypothetical protein